MQCEHQTVDRYTLVSDNRDDDDDDDDEATAAGGCDVTVPDMMSTDDRLTINIRRTLPSSTSDDVVEPEITVSGSDSDTKSGVFNGRLEVPVVSSLSTVNDKKACNMTSTSMDQSTSYLQTAEQANIDNAFHETSALRSGSSQSSGKPDHEKMFIEAASRDHQQVLDDVTNKSGHHSNGPVDRSSSVTSVDVDRPVASSNANPLDYCKSVSVDETDERRSEMMTMTSLMMTSRDDQTLDDNMCNVSSDELLYATNQSPPSTFCLL